MIKRKNGFTLMELLISISIIAILIVVGIVSYTSINKNSRDAKRRSDLEQIRSALEMYKADNGYYPSVGSGEWIDATTANLQATLVDSGYIASIPTDPKADTYKILMTSPQGSNYYGYCLSAKLEGLSEASSTCGSSVTLYGAYNYGLRNP